MYEMSPVTDRISKIREMYRTTIPQISISRYKLLTEYYQAHPEMTGLFKRANAYKYICENMNIAIHDHEMIVGGHAEYFHGSALFPENAAEWIPDEFPNNYIQERTTDPYRITEEDKQFVIDTVDFWVKNCSGAKVRASLPKGYKEHEGSLVCLFGPFSGGAHVGHFIVGHQRILDRGMRSIKEEAEEKMARMDEKGIGDKVDQYNFYWGISIVLEGAMTLAQRYSDLAAEKAAACEDPKRKAELELISRTMARVPAEPPRTFFEACQCVYFYQMVVTLDAQLHGTSFGRVDQYLGRYYEKDLAEGRITREQAQEIIDFMILKMAEQNKAISDGATKANPGYTSGQLVTLGGVDSRGEDATNEVTYMILEANARLVLHDPPLSLRIHKNTPERLWECAIEATRKCGGVPTFESDEAIVPALMKRGLSLEDARNYGLVGCVEPAGNGMEWPQCGGDGGDSFFLLPNALLLAINDGINPMRFPGAPEPTRTGVATGYLYEMESFEEVKQAYKAQVEFFAQWHINCTSAYEYIVRWENPVLIASAGIEGCMESGRDVTNMGAKYTNVGMGGIGIGNVADGLAAIKYLCYDKKLCTTREFYDALMSNWQGSARAEEIHGMIITEVPHFGNGEEYVDELGAWGAQVYADAFNGKKAYNGTFHAGLYPVTTHVMMGKMSFAGPDGRYTGDPFADGISGVQGRDVHGPMAVLSSVSHLDYTEYSNGTLLNMKFSPSAVNNESSKKKLAQLISTYMCDLQGMEMQLNIVSTAQMKDARAHPENYRDLVVRIAGFSAYFVEIQEEAKDDLIARTEMEELS
ncbi:MAG: glycyl radical protein [Coriobacteriales bacterium]|jgi:pyruvate formate-lyase/glycerol dehydratase family glycyl radical enzyme